MNPFRKVTPRARTTSASRPLVSPLPMFDELEQRVMLSVFFGEAPPDLSAMENTSNIIVRFNTNVTGDDGLSHFDVELFVSEDDDPVGTVENFLGYIREGQYDGMFFQRLQNLNANSDEPPEILQGGRNRLDDISGTVTVIDVDDPIDDEVVRENLERTLAMAKTSARNSATSQFFINLEDNEDELSPDIQPNGGFPVFGQVLGDRSWDLIRTIASLNVEDLQQRLSDPQFGGSPFPAVPVTDAFVGDGSVRFTDDMFVTILDVEIIKPEGSAGFFDQAVVIPEGFRNFRSQEILTVSNTNDEAADYQVILRYATTENRDFVIDFGTLEAGEQAEIVLSGPGALPEVRGFAPYAIEVQTASADAASVPVTATLRRSDFAGQGTIEDTFAGEELFNPEAIDPAERESTLSTWVFADAEKGEDVETFFTWINLSDDDGEVMIEFFFDDGTSTQLVTARELGRYRRGGVDVKGIGESVLPDGPFSARITSTVPIVAAMSTFRLNGPVPETGAALAIGQVGAGGPIAGIADIRRPEDGQGRLSLVNLGTTEAVVRLDFVNDSGSVLTSLFNRIGAGSRRVFDLAAVPGITLPVEGELSLRASVQTGGPAIAGQLTAFGAGGASGAAVGALGGTRHAFSGAISSDEDGFSESIALFNPGTQSTTATFVYHFSDGTRFSVMRTVEAGERTAIDISSDPQSDLAGIRNKIESAEEFETFSVSVITARTTAASLTRMEADGTRTVTTGTILAGLAPLG